MTDYRNRITGLEYVASKDLTPHPGNWREHGKAQTEALRGVLAEVGIAGALLAYRSERNGGALTVIDGHLRKDAAPQTWPVLVLDVDDAEADYLLAVHDPLAAMATADAAALDALLSSVNSGEAAVRAMLAELAKEAGLYGEPVGDDPGPQIDKAEELRQKWGTESGQLWALGEHRIVCGDCTDGAIVGRVMGEERAGACVTDPPYGINRNGIANDAPETLRALFDGCLATMPIDDGVLIAFQSPRLEWVWLDATRAAGWTPERLLWMYKPNDETFPWRGWLLKSEAIRASSRGRAQWLDVHPYAHDCYSPTTLGQELSESEGWHASVKPQAVVIDLVKRVGGLVYDPFIGSGTTLIACERLGRRCRGIEISPAYVAVTLERWSALTGKTPELLP